MNLTRRTVLGGTAAGLAFGGRARAQGKQKLRLGILTDMSGAFSSDSGPTAVACARQAIEEFNPSARGMEIELLVADHQNKPDIGVGIARHWFDEEGVDALLDVNNSAIAMALISVAQEKDKLQLNTGAGTGDLTGPRCSYNTIHWGWDTYVFAKSTGGQVLRSGGKTWFFITADYAFGHASQKDATEVILRNGGKVVGSVAFPGAGATTDFSSEILQAQSSGADVVGLCTSGIDFVNIIKQSAEFGVKAKGQRIAGLSVFINDIHGLGLQAAQGIYLTETFYWNLNDRTRAFLSRVKDKVGNNWPSMEQASAYAAARHYLKAVAEIGIPAANASGRATMEVMRKMPTDDDCFGVGRIREDGVVLHPSYLFQVKSPAESKEPWDYYKLISTTPADQAWRPLNETGCPLVKKAADATR